MEEQFGGAGARQSAGAHVLVSGASFAGLATAYWMHELGYQVTVVETASGLRKGGTPVDIEGPTIDIVRRMGIGDAVRAKALPPRDLEFKDVDDNTVGKLAHQTAADAEANRRYEVHRDDLLDIMFAAVAPTTEFIFERSVAQLEDDADRVAVTFDDGSRRDYAFVFGCDGNRSNTRRLAFGEGNDFSYFMGGYFFLKVVPAVGLVPGNVSEIFSVPGRTVMLNGYDDRTDIAFAFRSDREIDYSYRDRAHQRRLVQDRFDALGWKVPDLIKQVDADDDFYFDKLNQIRMPVWSKGRVVLVGDAGYCVSPLAGMGGSIAIIGAAALADAMRRHGSDHIAAFRAYEDQLRPFVEQVQEKAASFGLAMMFPSSDAEIAERDTRLHQEKLDL